VVFGDQSALNGSMIVLVAAAGAYVGGAPIWIPLTCGLLGGLNTDHVRNLEIRKIVVNTACTTLAAALSAELAHVVFTVSGPELLASLVSAIVAAATYWIVDNAAVSVVLTAVDGRPLVSHVRELVRSEALLVPFACAGFLAGYYALHGLAIWAAALVIFALLGIADVVVISPRTSSLLLPARRFVAVIAIIAPVVAIVLGAVFQAPPRLPPLLELAALAGFGGYLVDLFRPRRGGLFVLLTVVGAGFVLHSSAPVVGPLIVGMAGTIGLSVTRHLLVHEAEQMLLTTLTIVGVTALMPDALTSSLGWLFVAGLAIAFAGLVAWHVPLALEFRLRTDRKAWGTVADAARADLIPCIVIGAFVGMLGWVGAHAGVSGIGGVLIVVSLALALPVRVRAPSTSGLSESQLTDVVQSAVLGLPSSRLQDGS
jgi:hypothetical protein